MRPRLFEPRKARRAAGGTKRNRRGPASMRPRLFEPRKDLGERPRRLGTGDASMRPRLFEPWKGLWHENHYQSRLWAASMRPRLFEPRKVVTELRRRSGRSRFNEAAAV